jgi:hypothetical protein
MSTSLNKSTFDKFGGSVETMTLEELELELDIIKMALAIFVDSKLDPKLWQNQDKTYSERVRDLENEIFERGVLV